MVTTSRPEVLTPPLPSLTGPPQEVRRWSGSGCDGGADQVKPWRVSGVKLWRLWWSRWGRSCAAARHSLARRTQYPTPPPEAQPERTRSPTWSREGVEPVPYSSQRGQPAEQPTAHRAAGEIAIYRYRPTLCISPLNVAQIRGLNFGDFANSN